MHASSSLDIEWNHYATRVLGVSVGVQFSCILRRQHGDRREPRCRAGSEYQRWLALQVRSELRLSVVVPVMKYVSIQECLFLLLNSIVIDWDRLLNNYICRIIIPKNFSLTTTFFFLQLLHVPYTMHSTLCTVHSVLYAVWMLNSQTYVFCRNSFCQAERQT